MRYLRYALLGLLALTVTVVTGSSPTRAWTAPAALNTNASSDSGADWYPQVTADGGGNWVAVWQSEENLGGFIGTDWDILVSRSTDNGATWTAPAALNANASTDSGEDSKPQVTTDGGGNWVAAWNSDGSLGGTIGGDFDILVSRSTDNGATWTAPAALNTNAATDSGKDIYPQVQTDDAGNWVAVWYSTGSLSGTIGTDFDILVARSTDNGASWTAPAALNTNAASDSGIDGYAEVTTDGGGNWVTVWYSKENLDSAIGTDGDILVARSTDNGATWTAPAILNTNAATDSGDDLYPQVTTDGAGNWVTAWMSYDSLGGTISTDTDILVSRSTDNGATWTDPAALNTNAAIDSGLDWLPQVTTDGRGNWVAVWYSNNSLGGTIGTDSDILVAHSADDGANWTPAAALNTNASTDSETDNIPQVTTDDAGNWVAVWQSEDSLGGTIGTDWDILYSTWATFTVDSTGDGGDFSTADGFCDTDDSVGDGPCTLRAAIEQANVTGGADTINFNIAGAGPHTISPGSALPTITDPVTIDGYTQPGASPNTNPPELGSNAVLKIELEGSGAGVDVNGLYITAGSSTVKGLVINRFSTVGPHYPAGNGIALETDGGNSIEGNYIGTDVAGTVDLGNRANGVAISGAPDNTIGGTAAGDGNVISGNSYGVYISGSGATGNQVEGNFIGPDVTGTAGLGDSFDGVVINQAPGNTIGGTAAGAGNVISGNGQAGVVIDNSSATGNVVQGNLIGTDVTGTADLGNGMQGVVIVMAPSNTIGGAGAGAGNVISGNGYDGVEIMGMFSDDAAGNLVQGNIIGTDVTGTADLGNSGDGVHIGGASGTIIGGTAAGERNVISGNDGHGVWLWDATGTKVEGNIIGTDVTGTVDLGNSGNGVHIREASSNAIGGTVSGAGNTISGNDSHGIYIYSGATGNTVEGNYIGTDVNGTADLGNSSNGVYIEGSPSNTIGGTAPGARNVISGNDSTGVEIRSESTGNAVEGNYIGTDVTGTAALGNERGVAIEESSNNTIGGTAPAARNIISGNEMEGVAISVGFGVLPSGGNQVQGNYIGTDVTGTLALGNSATGLYISGSSDNTIGGTTGTTPGGPCTGACNVISGNDYYGVYIFGSNATGNQVQGNYIGTDVTGTADLGNSPGGVIIGGGAGNTIGGTAVGAGNTIAFNNGDGVFVDSGTGNRIDPNSIHSNTGLGIDLGTDDVTANDPDDPDTGANNLQNFPVLTSATSGPTATIQGTLDSTPSTMFTLEFFSNSACDVSGNGEGETFLGSTVETTDVNGDVSFTASFGTPVAGGQFITATATDPSNNTSEFSECEQVLQHTFSDSLQTGTLNPAKWGLGVDAFGSVDPQPDGVHMSILPDTYAEVYGEGVDFECTVIGDFDASIDFELLNWPAAGQMRIGLMQDFANVMRFVEPGGENMYVADVKGNMQAAATTDTAGSLRLSRTGTAVTAYYWDTSSGWVALQSFDDPDFAKRTYIHFRMWGHWATTGAEVAWQNFAITADTLNCPDPSQPFTPTFTMTGDSIDANDPTIVPTGDTCLVGLPCKVAPRLQIPAGQALNGLGPPREIPALRALEIARGLDVPIGTVIGRYNMSMASDLGSSDTCDTQLDVSLPLVNAAIPERFGGGPDGTGAQSERGRADLWPMQFEWQPELRYWLSQGAEVWTRYQAIWDDIGGTGANTAINWVWLKTVEGGWRQVFWLDGYAMPPNWFEFCTPLDATWNLLGETQDGSNLLTRCIVEGTHVFQPSFTSQWTGETVTLSDSLTCQLPDFTDGDSDSIDNSIDGRYISSSFVDDSLVYSDDFTDEHLGGTTYGTIVSRGGVQLQVLDEADPRGVRLIAEGAGQPAEVNVCGGTLMYLEGGNHVVVTCGSTEIIVTQGNPVTVFLGTMIAELPAGSSVAVTETAPNTFSVESLSQSWEPVVVGGVELDPGESAVVTDGDIDGLADTADPCPADPDCDSDGVSDGSNDPDGGGGIVAGPDNCPNWFNQEQELPPWTVPPDDPDCDGFDTTVENWAGTLPAAQCGDSTPNNESPQPWPTDNNDDTWSKLDDVLRYIPVFNTLGPLSPAEKRFDLNADDKITLADVLTFIPYFNKQCT